jgi:integrase
MTGRRHFGSVRKRGIAWEVAYWHEGRRHLAPTRFSSKSDALGFLSAIETEIRRGTWVDPAARQMTVTRLAGLWLDSNPAKRESTEVRDEIVIRLHIVPAIGTWRIDRVTPSDVQRLVTKWSGPRSPRSVRREYGVLRAVFAFAVANDWLGRSPCRNVHLPALDRSKRHDLKPEDVDRIAAHVIERYRPMVWLGAVLGLRWSEVVGLRVGRIDLLGRTITVAESVTRGFGGRLVSGPPKSNAGLRTVSLPASLVEMLARHLASAGLTAADADAFAFTDVENGVIRYENWRRRIWIPAVTMAGCSGAGFHDLRRLAATTLVISGVDVKTAQVRLGHSDPRMTLSIYASAPVEADRDAAERLEGQFFGPRANEPANNHAAREILRAKYAPNGRSRSSAGDPNPG